MKNWKFILLFACFALSLALMLPVTALAGGWAVITLDELPEDPQAGQPVTIGFTVLQHGRTPMTGLDPTITLVNLADGETMVVAARPEGEPGHYTADLLFPAEGNWEWSIQAFSMDQPMPSLVVSPNPQARVSEPAGSSLPLPLMAGAFVLVSLAGALLLLFRARFRWALALLVAGLLVGGAGFAFAANQTPASASPPAGSLSLVESGQQLFVAKGCTTCHVHEQIARDTVQTIYVDAGPDLSDFSADPEYLTNWLADPASIKSKTEMPDLNLDQAEIQALVEFLNSD